MTGDIYDRSNEILTLTEDDMNTYLLEKQMAGLKATGAAKYRSHLQHLCKWLEGKSMTRELLLAWRESLEAYGYSKVTIEKYVTSVNLYTKHRGRSDLNIKKSNALDLRGKQFGYLTAIEPTEKRSRTDVVWRCRCKCGKEIEVPAGLLARGNTTSCGCLAADIFDYHNRYVDGTELRQSLTDNPISTRAASGYTGVTWDKGKWLAYITYKKKYHKLGYYDKIEDAVKARAKAKQLVMEDAALLYEETDHRYTEKPGRPPRQKKEPKAELVPTYHVRRNDNTTGCAGVKCEGVRWKAEISLNGIRYHLGLHETFESAVAVRKQAEILALAKDEDAISRMSHSATTYKTKVRIN